MIYDLKTYLKITARTSETGWAHMQFLLQKSVVYHHEANSEWICAFHEQNLFSESL